MRPMTRLMFPERLLLLLLVVVVSAGDQNALGDATGEGSVASLVGAPQRIDVFPAQVQFAARRRRMQLIVTGFYRSGHARDLTRVAQTNSSDPSVVQVVQGVAIPAGNGSAQIIITVAGLSHRIPVEVSGFSVADPISFQHETLAILTRQGCNAGICHGAPLGKSQFRLSLMAFDPQRDAITLTREFAARRINRLEPESSLLLRKPLMKVEHGGGKRLRESGLAYEILKTWIDEGCRTDDEPAIAFKRLEVYPQAGRVNEFPTRGQQLLVLAHFNDGSVRDVTKLSKFSSSNEMIATMDEDGLLVAKRRGIVAGMARYGEHIQSTVVTFVRSVEGFTWTEPVEQSFIDRHIHAKLKQMNYRPSQQCRDDEFLRRVYLDVTGRLPEVEVVETFLADHSPDKRVRLIDRLLSSQNYHRFWALKWGDLLNLTRDAMGRQGANQFYEWLVSSLAANQPLDQFCHELLTAQGSTLVNPPANYFCAHKDNPQRTEAIAQAFLGVRIKCAKCHNHPFESWTQQGYLGLSAFFDQIEHKEGASEDEKIVWLDEKEEVTVPSGLTLKSSVSGKVVPWVPVDGPLDVSAMADKRLAFTQWLTRPGNPFFARVAVNRIWSQVMGKGIVEPVDDFRDSNPPSNPELLDALAADFIDSGFDRKHLLRVILNSRAYQRSSQTGSADAENADHFSRTQVRMLSAEQLLDALSDVTEVPEQFNDLPLGTPATQLPIPDTENSFLVAFGQPVRKTVCSCERGTDSNLTQALELFNGDVVSRKLSSQQNRLHRLVAAGVLDEDIVREIYLATLCRPPSSEEARLHAAHLSATADRLQALQDVCWAVLNTQEFVFQH